MQKSLVVLVKLLSVLPLWLLHALSWISYLFLFHVFKVRRKLTIKNIKSSFPEYSDEEVIQLAKNHYKSTCMVLAETIKALRLSKQEIKNRVERAMGNLADQERYRERMVFRSPKRDGY